MLMPPPETDVRVLRAYSYPCYRAWEWGTETVPLETHRLWHVCHGEGYLDSTAGRHVLERGVAVLLQPGQRYVARHRPDNPLILYIAHLRLRDGTGEPLDIATPGKPLVHVAFGHDIFFETLFERLIAADESGDAGLAQAWARAMLAELACPGRKMTLNLVVGRGADYAAEMKILRWKIGREGGREPTLAELAHTVGMSRSQLCRCYAKANGTPPHHDIIATRIRKAKGMLRNSRWTIKEIAERLGYCGPHFFCRQFKACVGMTPGAFRRARPEVV